MTSGAAVLVIVVATGGARDPATVALVASVEEAIGTTASIRVEEIGEPSDTGALRVERDLRATAVATLVWRDSSHLSATVRLHMARSDAWTNRTIVFSPQDETAERGRTLGLVVAALWIGAQPGAPATAAANPPPATAPPPPPPKPAAPPEMVAPKPVPPRAEKPAADAPPKEIVTKRAPPAEPLTRRKGRFAVGVGGVGALGVAGPASAAGASIEGLAFLSERLALRVGASGRTGPLPGLPGSDTVGTAGAGAEVWLLDPGATFSLGVRVDALAIVHRVGDDADAEVHSRWLPGGDLRLEAAVRLGEHVDWLLGFGVEAAAGSTEIRKGVDRATVATIPALRLLGETGLRWVF